MSHQFRMSNICPLELVKEKNEWFREMFELGKYIYRFKTFYTLDNFIGHILSCTIGRAHDWAHIGAIRKDSGNSQSVNITACWKVKILMCGPMEYQAWDAHLRVAMRAQGLGNRSEGAFENCTKVRSLFGTLIKTIYSMIFQKMISSIPHHIKLIAWMHFFLIE